MSGASEGRMAEVERSSELSVRVIHGQPAAMNQISPVSKQSEPIASIKAERDLLSDA